MTTQPLAFIDLAAQRRRLGKAVEEAMLRVVEHGNYILGPEVKAFENDLAAFCGAKHVISCANGTDALGLVLMAKDIKEGDAVFCPSFTFAATAEVVAWTGATAIFCDCFPDSFNLDPASLEAGIKVAKEKGLRPAVVIPVDLFGQPADYEAIEPICEREGMLMLCDAAQSFGASFRGRKVGAIGVVTTTSFFPAKPLGCYGDGGAIFTEDTELAELLTSLRFHGKGSDKYDNVRIGMNARLDTLQAAILIEKLKIFAEEMEARDRIAARYNELLADVAIVPRLMEGATSVWAQYTLRLPGFDRDAFQAALKREGVPTAVYYPKPLHQQTAYRHYPVAGNGLPISEKLAAEVISLPMHPYLDEKSQDRVVSAVRDAIAAQGRRAAAE
jgi:dTDP-4-amino-4,6-dideoxygalactose transaminase